MGRAKTAYLETVFCCTGLLSSLPIFVFGCQGNAATVVQILHEPEEGEFIEEDLWDLHQKVLPAVLQSTAHKFTKRVLKRVKCQKGCSSFDLLKLMSTALEPGIGTGHTCSMPPSCLWKKRTNSLLSSFCWVRVRTMRRTDVSSWREHTSSMFS